MTSCQAIEDDLQECLSPLSSDAFQIFNVTSDQVIVAGMGAILSIQHQAIHEYMRTQYDFSKLEYRYVFNFVVSIDRIAAKMRERHKPPEKTGGNHGGNKTIMGGREIS